MTNVKSRRREHTSLGEGAPTRFRVLVRVRKVTRGGALGRERRGRLGLEEGLGELKGEKGSA